MKEEKFLYTKNPLTEVGPVQTSEINNSSSEDKTENSLQKSARSCFTEKQLANLPLLKVREPRQPPWHLSLHSRVQEWSAGLQHRSQGKVRGLVTREKC